jgi:DMSO/TMAO reductase YedYZ molybdopterin-dependent catalytic subunit
MILEIEGDGVSRRELSYEQLAAMPEQVAHTSVSFGWREVGGVRVSSVLRAIGLPDRARFVTFMSADGYSTTMPLSAADGALLVIRIGEAPLSVDRGGPVRLVTGKPDLRSCLKHVTTIRITVDMAGDVLPHCDRHPARAA